MNSYSNSFACALDNSGEEFVIQFSQIRPVFTENHLCLKLSLLLSGNLCPQMVLVALYQSNSGFSSLRQISRVQ